MEKVESFALLGKTAKYILKEEGHNETVTGIYHAMKSILSDLSQEERAKLSEEHPSMDELCTLIEKTY